MAITVTVGLAPKTRQRADGKRLVVYQVNCDGKRTHFSNDIALHEVDWNGETKAERGVSFVKRSNPHYAEINRSIKNFALRIENAYWEEKTHADKNGQPVLLEDVKRRVRPNRRSQHDFLDTFFQYIDTTNKNHGTFVNKRATWNYLQEFVEKTGKPLTFENINVKFADKFSAFMYEEKDSQDGIVRSRLSHIKTFMKWALERNYHTNTAYQQIKPPTQPKEKKPALTEQHLQSIQKVELANDTEEFVRNLFFVQVYSGIRYSDIKKVINANTGKGTALITYAQKTGEEITIPLEPQLKRILQILQGSKPLSLSHYNSTLKKICKKAGISEIVTRTETTKGKKIRLAEPLYEVVGSHTARRTFATISHKKGVNLATIQKVTGHKDLETLQQYISVNDESVQEEYKGVFDSIEEGK
jgi:site-specific recombinase XerD